MAHGTVIIGNGVAGVTTARFLRKNSDERIQIVSQETPYFFSRTALMYVYMGHMQFDHIKPYEDWFWEKNRIELVQATVEKVDTAAKLLQLSTGENIAYDKLVIATGSRTKYYDWEGQDLKGVQGLVSFQDLQLLESNTPAPFEQGHPVKHCVIIGAGLIGVELAEMLRTRDIKVTMLIREKVFWGSTLTQNEGLCINDHVESHGVQLLFNKDLDIILGDENGHVRAVQTKDGDEIECQLVGITTGVTPNVEFLNGSGIEVDKGILVNEMLETNIAGIYAAGDCAKMRKPQDRRKAIEPIWYVGRMMGEVLGKTIAGKNTPYIPGPWFNSAKFFDIEYVTYGLVKNKPDETQAHYFWKKEGQNKFMTLSYDPETEELIGINSFGIRLQHEYFNNVLKNKMKIGQVVGGIHVANFDPEFDRKWHKDLQRDFELKTGIKVRKPSMLKKLLQR